MYIFIVLLQWCGNQLSLTIYTLVIAAILPSLINIILNIIIFSHVRSSARRIHPQAISALTSDVTAQQPKISRREISLLRQMIFMFLMFIGGWTPVYIVNILDAATDLNFMIVQIAVIFSQICVLGIVINLFIYNHELRQYLSNKIRVCFHC
ncbi:unnamed protein product [Adineta steineri]|uniref:G-protein coupled receptors family 1 profile domain-containing protein n=3 Tax=Adineta steineri TaxID=433720 RepID=A0A814Q8R1_9BILA|nr:unnamed protein product [Adineta steineri]CAF1419468.1 unnamed protein product [Adineta steineri]